MASSAVPSSGFDAAFGLAFFFGAPGFTALSWLHRPVYCSPPTKCGESAKARLRPTAAFGALYLVIVVVALVLNAGGCALGVFVAALFAAFTYMWAAGMPPTESAP